MLCLLSAGSVNFLSCAFCTFFYFKMLSLALSIKLQTTYSSTIIFTLCSISAEIADAFKLQVIRFFASHSLTWSIKLQTLTQHIFKLSVRFMLRLPTRTLHTVSFFARQLQDENSMTSMTQLKLLMNS